MPLARFGNERFSPALEFVMDEDDERFTFAFRRFSIRCDRLERVDRAECTGLR